MTIVTNTRRRPAPERDWPKEARWMRFAQDQEHVTSGLTQA